MRPPDTSMSFIFSNLTRKRFGRPIPVDPYKEQFFSESEGAPRAAVKRLTRAIETELVENSINAPDWHVYSSNNKSEFSPLSFSSRDTLYAARMVRDLLWEKERSIPLEDFVAISQT